MRSFYGRGLAAPIPVDTGDVTEAESGQSDNDFEPDVPADLSSEGEDLTSEDESSPSRPSTTNLRWKKKERQLANVNFDHESGADIDSFAACSNAVDVFRTFLDDTFIEHIVEQSNIYSMQQHLTTGHRLVDPITCEDILIFIGITFLMGYHRLPSIKDYWSKMNDLGVEPVRSAMPRNRYEDIASALHLNDNAARNHDKLYKIRPMVSFLNNQFQKLYNPDQNQSVDEGMILFKGRSSIKQYNPMKPIKRGFKLWCRAETNGKKCEMDDKLTN